MPSPSAAPLPAPHPPPPTAPPAPHTARQGFCLRAAGRKEARSQDSPCFPKQVLGQGAQSHPDLYSQCRWF